MRSSIMVKPGNCPRQLQLSSCNIVMVTVVVTVVVLVMAVVVVVVVVARRSMS